MAPYFEAPDGHGESTVWARNPDRPDHPVAIIRSHDVHTHYWPDVVARMTGTTDGIERTHDGIRVDRAIHPRGRQ